MTSVSHHGSTRRYERVTVDFSLRIVKNGIVNFGRAQDLSNTGMSAYAPTELAAGDEIKAIFTLPNSRMRLEVAALVKNRIGFRYGLEFKHLSDTDRAEIARVTGILALTQH